MVVLSASIITRSGKALVSRQYVEMTRMRIEGLIAAFPKLVGHSKQHTFVETDTVRYVYQPLENHLYLILLTTKTSNIVEDLSTLRLLAKVVPDVAGGLQENNINENAFELIFAFDEVLTAGGYREDATLSSIRTNLQMESHEETMFKIIEEKKKEEAKNTMKAKQLEIQKRQMQQLKANVFNQNGLGGSAPTGGMVGFGGGGQAPSGAAGMFEGFGGDTGPTYESGGGFNPSSFDTSRQEPEEPAAPRVPVKGMKLGGGKTTKKDSLMAAMAAEDNFSSFSSFSAKDTAAAFGLAPVPAKPATPAAPATISLEEKISVLLNREGGVESAEIKGILNYTANTDQGQFVSIAVNKKVLAARCTENWSFGTSPKINKSNYEKKGILVPKDTKKGFPLNRQMGILRWSYASDDAAPLTVNCWPEDDGDGTINVTIEYEFIRSEMTLRDVNIVLPLGTTDPPAIESIDGNYKHDPHSGLLCWHHDQIDANNDSGSIEFAIAGSNPEVFFPVKVSFASNDFLCPIEVEGISAIDGGATVPNTMSKNVIPDSYQCV